MNTETLGNLVTALRDAQKNPNMVATFTFESWGFPRDADERDGCLRDAFEKDSCDPEYDWEDAIDYEFFNSCIDKVITILPHNCGAPACALGHYALRPDLQDFAHLDHMGSLMLNHFTGSKEAPMGVGDERIAAHFGIEVKQALKLFGSNGCDHAETPGDAADYIEYMFMKRNSDEKE